MFLTTCRFAADMLVESKKVVCGNWFSAAYAWWWEMLGYEEYYWITVASSVLFPVFSVVFTLPDYGVAPRFASQLAHLDFKI